MLRRSQRGFAIIVVVIAIVVIAILAVSSWYFWQSSHKKDSKNSQAASSQDLSNSGQGNSPSQASGGQTSGSGIQDSTTAQSTKTQEKPSRTDAGGASSSPTSDPNTGSAYEIYRISSDGASAQESPASVTLSHFSSVVIIIELQCSGTCKFKLVSDKYTLANTATYTSSQRIRYTVSRPGSYSFYNQYTPDTKFTVSF